MPVMLASHAQKKPSSNVALDLAFLDCNLVVGVMRRLPKSWIGNSIEAIPVTMRDEAFAIIRNALERDYFLMDRTKY